MKPTPEQLELTRQYKQLRDSNASNYQSLQKTMLDIYDKQLFALESVEEKAELTNAYKKQRDEVAQKFRDTQALLKTDYERQFKEMGEK